MAVPEHTETHMVNAHWTWPRASVWPLAPDLGGEAGSSGHCSRGHPGSAGRAQETARPLKNTGSAGPGLGPSPPAPVDSQSHN